MNFSGLFVGPLLKEFSYRKVAIAGSLLCSLGLALTSPAKSMSHILATYSVINGKWINWKGNLKTFYQIQFIWGCKSRLNWSILWKPQTKKNPNWNQKFSIVTFTFVLHFCVKHINFPRRFYLQTFLSI